MCQYCEPLLKAIDAYLAKADDDLADSLNEAGYIEADETVKAANELEDGITDALERETEQVVAGLKDSKDLKSFAKKVWPKIKGKDLVNENITEVVSTLLQTYVPHYVDIYIKATDKNLTCTRMSKKSIAWIDSWSKDLAFSSFSGRLCGFCAVLAAFKSKDYVLVFSCWLCAFYRLWNKKKAPKFYAWTL